MQLSTEVIQKLKGRMAPGDLEQFLRWYPFLSALATGRTDPTTERQRQFVEEVSGRQGPSLRSSLWWIEAREIQWELRKLQGSIGDPSPPATPVKSPPPSAQSVDEISNKHVDYETLLNDCLEPEPAQGLDEETDPFDEIDEEEDVVEKDRDEENESDKSDRRRGSDVEILDEDNPDPYEDLDWDDPPEAIP